VVTTLGYTFVNKMNLPVLAALARLLFIAYVSLVIELVTEELIKIDEGKLL